MRKRYGKFYADWRDEHGIRHMKACRSIEAARRFTAKMHAAVTTKKARAAKPSRESAVRGRRRRAKTRTGGTSRSS